MKVKSESEIVQSCPTLSDPVDCSLPGSSIHGIFQARGLERGAIAFSSKTPGRCQTLGKQQGDCSPAMSGDKKARAEECDRMFNALRKIRSVGEQDFREIKTFNAVYSIWQYGGGGGTLIPTHQGRCMSRKNLRKPEAFTLG